jgi:hypothetical protein
MYIDDFEFDSTGYSPGKTWSANWMGQFYAETYDLEDDIVGTAGGANHVNSTHLGWYDSGGTFHDFSSVIQDPASGSLGAYHNQVYSHNGTPAVGLWTDPVSRY